MWHVSFSCFPGRVTCFEVQQTDRQTDKQTYLADDKHGDNRHKHQSDVILPWLSDVHPFPVSTWPADRQDKTGVDDGQRYQRNNTHDGQVEPGVVDSQVDWIGQQRHRRGDDYYAARVNFGDWRRWCGWLNGVEDDCLFGAVFEPAREIVHGWYHTYYRDHYSKNTNANKYQYSSDKFVMINYIIIKLIKFARRPFVLTPLGVMYRLLCCQVVMSGVYQVMESKLARNILLSLLYLKFWLTKPAVNFDFLGLARERISSMRLLCAWLLKKMSANQCAWLRRWKSKWINTT